MSTRGDRTPPRPSRRRPRGAPTPTRHGRLPASSWLPFGPAEATDQPQWMSITLARRCRQFPRSAVVVKTPATPMADASRQADARLGDGRLACERSTRQELSTPAAHIGYAGRTHSASSIHLASPAHRASSSASIAWSPPAISMIFVRLAAPVISVTAPRRTPKACATAAVPPRSPCPRTARAGTRTTSASWCRPPTLAWKAPGRTRMVTLTPAV
jgi:hypothetical protein